MTPSHAWALIDGERVIEVSLDKSNLAEAGRGERIIKVKLNV